MRRPFFLPPLFIALLCALAGTPAFAQESPAAAAVNEHPRIRFETTMGSFTLQLDARRAPLTVENFLRYVAEGHYEGTIFTRVTQNFIAQTGGYTVDFVEKPTHDPVPNESGNGLSNQRGTVAMARTGSAHTATSQFFINMTDNPGLNPLPTRWGYAVFGEVIEGMDVIDRIGNVLTDAGGPFEDGVPIKPVIVQKAELL